jgi:streptomycin 6-kinase
MAIPLNLPPDFQQRIRDVHGAAGEAWLRRLPALLDEAAARWGLRFLPPFEPLSYNYAAPAVEADGREVVLKAGVPSRLRRSEIAALRAYGGRGAVLLLDADPDAGLILLERLRPGTTLAQADLPEEAATAATAAVLRALRRLPPPGHNFPTIEKWGAAFGRLRARFDGGTGPLPSRLVESAEHLYAELCASAAAPVLLHGDLHHGNILAAERLSGSPGWLAIDPQGVVGEPAYETGALLRNPFPAILSAPDARSILARRADQLAEELGFDRQRVRGWAFAQAVLSAIWEVEDHGDDVQAWVAVAELLSV